MAGYGIQIKGSGRALMKKGGRSFPDLTGDGKVTRADVLKGRGVFARGGQVRDLKKPKAQRSKKPRPAPKMPKRLMREPDARRQLARPKMMGGGRANLLEEMGRIDSEKMNPNRRAEKRRVISELNRGYKKGGRVGFKDGTPKMISIPTEKQVSKRGFRVSSKKVPSGGKEHQAFLKKQATENRDGMKKGGKVPKGYHRTKDGRVAKKGLDYYMNRAKKRGTSKPGKGSVSDKALKQSAKTAKK